MESASFSFYVGYVIVSPDKKYRNLSILHHRYTLLVLFGCESDTYL